MPEAAEPTVSADAPMQIIPVGQQTIRLRPELANQLATLAPAAWPDLMASRVWFERRRGRLVLHLGDVTIGRFDDDL